MKRVAVAFAASIVLTLATGLPIRADGLTLATVSCTDGTSFSASVDTDTLTALQQSIEAMTLYPAGLNCTLGTAPLLTAMGVASAWTATGFVVGGGRFQMDCPSGGGTFWTNFGLSAHNVDGTTTGEVKSGTFNLAIPDGPTQCVGPSNFTSKPYCLVISDEPPGPPSSAWYAWFNATVKEVHGDFFTNVAGLTPGSDNNGAAVKDTGNPGHQTIGPDAIAPRPFKTSCPATGDPAPDAPWGWHDALNGNITIHPQSQL